MVICKNFIKNTINIDNFSDVSTKVDLRPTFVEFDRCSSGTKLQNFEASNETFLETKYYGYNVETGMCEILKISKDYSELLESERYERKLNKLYFVNFEDCNKKCITNKAGKF